MQLCLKLYITVNFRVRLFVILFSKKSECLLVVFKPFLSNVEAGFNSDFYQLLTELLIKKMLV